jgi:hypothetical protein
MDCLVGAQALFFFKTGGDRRVYKNAPKAREKI